MADGTSQPPPLAGDVFKCRHCAFTVLKWRTGKDGARISGWAQLQTHLGLEHDIDVDLTGNAPGEEIDERFPE